MNFQRARTDLQRKDRINEIISAASELYNRSGYEGINFSAISELTEFTRPTIYKYFSTKEEILLQLLSDDIGVWVDRLVSSFKLNRIYHTKEISAIWAQTLSTQKRMNELYSILFTVLEKNASKKAIINFKQSLFLNATPLNELLCQLFPFATQEQITSFVTIQFSLAVGYYPMCHLSDIQMEAMQSINSDYVIPDFEKGYQKAIYQILLSLEHTDTDE